jgi:hypothetical protein
MQTFALIVFHFHLIYILRVENLSLFLHQQKLKNGKQAITLPIKK